MTEQQQAVNTAAAAAPQTLVLGTRTFVVAPPSLADIFAQRAEARRQVQEAMVDPLDLLNRKISAAEKAGRPYSPTLIAALSESAMKSGSSKDAKPEPTDAQLFDQVTKSEMMYWWAWFMVKKTDPTVTMEDVKGWVSEEEIYRVSSRLGEIMALSKDLNPN